ncbi:predicted protein [Uncinocarpus reesii 1704]|uniref:Uncharacterized protein n=1 Tax=Uncinocarpus reesii (strain UAMH 1704) TaxID=336963 RepID=C4JW43_UNCRE|nr:uncharacterized protein UREG_06785 [Uncinocarpus reesii 1704]EEP81920.1 predicted protein [Uncinocarpus reesii 1704]
MLRENKKYKAIASQYGPNGDSRRKHVAAQETHSTWITWFATGEGRSEQVPRPKSMIAAELNNESATLAMGQHAFPETLLDDRRMKMSKLNEENEMRCVETPPLPLREWRLPRRFCAITRRSNAVLARSIKRAHV